MNKQRRFDFATLLMVCALITPKALATPAGDAAIVAKLATLVEDGQKHLSTVKEMASADKYLAKAEGLRHIKTLADTGRAYRDLVSELGMTYRQFQELLRHPYKQVDALREDIEYMKRQYKNANNDKDFLSKLDSYAGLIAYTDQIAIIDESLSRARKKRMLSGLSETEAIQTTAENSAIFAELLLGQERARVAKEAEEARKKMADFQRMKARASGTGVGGLFGGYHNE